MIQSGMLAFSDNVYIQKAIDEELLEESSEPSGFVFGHLTGIDAIRLYFNSRVMQHSRTCETYPKHNVNEIKTKLSAFLYDGKSLDEIIRDATKELGEGTRLLHEILAEAGRARLLSFDLKYALPAYVKKQIDCAHEKFFPLHQQFQRTKESNRPRSRHDISEFLREKDLAVDCDEAITYLVSSRLL
jgi:hypothetical protein